MAVIILRQRGRSLFHRQRGSASVEFFIAGLAAIPLFTLVPLIGKQLDTDFRTVQAARYTSWERTVWGEGGELAKSRRAIGEEVNDRFFGHRSTDVADIATLRREGVTEEPLWRHNTHRSMLTNAGVALPGKGDNVRDTRLPGGHDAVVSRLATSGITSLMGLGGLGLNPNGYMLSQVELPLTLDITSMATLNVTQQASGGILTDAWNAGSTRLSRTNDLTLQTPVRAAVNIGTYALSLPPMSLFFPEAASGKDADLTPDANIVPLSYYKD